jgi:hypothetical protein
MEENNPAIRENSGRNADGTFRKGFSGNPSGRPKGTLKDYVRKKFMEMSEEEKEDFIAKIDPLNLWQMGEGRPAQDNILKGDETAPIIHQFEWKSEPSQSTIPQESGPQDSTTQNPAGM